MPQTKELCFGPIAPYYDDLMRRVPYYMWANYYRLLLAHQGVSARRLLDVCCGTGSVAELLTDERFEVTGIDISAPMIEVARQKALESGREVRYEVADACVFDLGERFDAAYSFFDSLNYITDPADLRAAIARVAAHLLPGGSFVFDLNTEFAFAAKLFDQHDMKKSAPIRYKWVGHWDPGTRLIRVDMEFWRGKEWFTETHWQRAYSDEEIRGYLADAGFGRIECFESYTLDRPRAKSDRVHYAAILGA
jgi:SAM-dependent methyltransferase